MALKMDNLFWKIVFLVSLCSVSVVKADDPCATAPCNNNGTCRAGSDAQFFCDCTDGWVGDTCDLDDPCTPTNPCHNDGICSNDASGNFVCQCPNGWAGDTCDIARLTVQGDQFLFDNKTVFLSGGNLPWIKYGYDFGDHQWTERKCHHSYPYSCYTVRAKVEEQIRKLHEAGGNSLRLWIHIQGESTPAFNASGYVTAPDHQGTLFDDIKDLLNIAKRYDVLVFPTLWNCAVDQDDDLKLDGLITDGGKLQSYIDNVLTPMVKEMKDHPALGGWDIINEPEGMIKPNAFNMDKCYDTRAFRGSGAGWAGERYDYRQMLRFINWQADAIKAADPGTLVTIGAWNPKSNSFGMTNHYSDDCLIKTGGRHNGTLDFYSIHSHSWEGQFDRVAAFVNSEADYKLDKPVVVGEFWSQRGGNYTDAQMFDYVYNHGYAGAWSWDVVHFGHNQRKGITLIKDLTHNGEIHIDIK